MKTEKTANNRDKQNVIIIILVLLLGLNIGLRLILAPHRPPVTVKTGAGKELKAVLDLNTATEEELAMLPGIGPVRARQITEYRSEHGRFSSIDELKNIKGLGNKTISSIAGMLQVE